MVSLRELWLSFFRASKSTPNRAAAKSNSQIEIELADCRRPVVAGSFIVPDSECRFTFIML